MQRKEAAELLAIIAGALRDNPTSFTYEINLTGFKAQNTGGVGFLAAPTGGGPGSTTIGMQSSASISGNELEVVQKQVSAEQSARIANAADTISLIAAEIEKNAPDAGRVQRWLNELPVHLIGAALFTVITRIAERFISG